MKKSMRKGFTLVELLIVIVVIGILSAMMMLSSTEAVSSARAADIISDLRNLKTAALAWYADNLDYVEGKVQKNSKNFAKLSDEKADVQKYLGNEGLKDSYTFSEGKDTDWYVWCNVTDAKVFEKLKSRAKTVGLVLMGSNNTTSADLSATTSTTGSVGMFIR